LFPRDDLDGRDIPRKLTILARLAGLTAEGPSSFPVQSLILMELEGCKTSDEFMQRLSAFDSEIEVYRANAAKEGKMIRYLVVIEVSSKTIKAGLQMVEKISAIGSLQGTAQLISFATKLYPSLLLVQGAGAGTEITALGVTADLVKVIHLQQMRDLP